MNWYAKLVAIAVIAIPLYLWRVTLFGIPTTVFELLVASLVVIGLATPSIREQWRAAEQMLPRPLVLLIAVFIFSTFLSCLISDVPAVSFGIFKSLIITPLLLGWIVYAGIGGSIQSALIVSGVVVSCISALSFRWGDRLSGIYDVPNSLALYIAPLTVVATTAALTTTKWRAWYILAAVIMGVTLLVTQSIAGLCATLLVVGIVAFKTRGGHLMVKITSLAVMIGVMALYLFATGRVAYMLLPITDGEANSVSVRLQLWSVASELIQEHPLLGIGLGQFEPAYQQKLHERFASLPLSEGEIKRGWKQPLREFVFRDPHNWLLSFWLNTGLLGLLSFLALHVYLVWRVVNLKPITSNLLPPVVALLTLVLFGLVDTIYWKNDLAAVHWVLLALLGGSLKNGLPNVRSELWANRIENQERR